VNALKHRGRAARQERNNPHRAQRPRCFPLPKERGFPKGTSPQATRPRHGVSTYLALTFGTLLSSQGTEASLKTAAPTKYYRDPSGLSLRCFQLTRPFPVRFPLAYPFRWFHNRKTKPNCKSKVMVVRDRRCLGAMRSPCRRAPCSSGLEHVRRSAVRSQTTGPPEPEVS